MKNETIFEFVRFSIDDSITEFCHPDDLDWEMLDSFSMKHCLTGVLYVGLEKLSKNHDLPIEVIGKWHVEAEIIKQLNERLNEAVVAVTSQFEKDGFPNCVLKGQGNAMMYPVPSLRSPGDIDIWLMGERDRIFKYVRKDFPDTEMLYHHLKYPIFEDVMVEVHFFPMFLNNPIYNWRFQKWIKTVAEEQCNNRVTLPQGSFCRPTTEFNIIYQLAHIRHHFFDEGIGLRQIMDYYYLIKDEKVLPQKDKICDLLTAFGLTGFAKAVMYVLKVVFDLDERFFLARPDAKIGQMLLDEIMMTGNFGKNDSRYGDLKRRSRVYRLSALLKKNLRFWWYFPGEVVCSFLFRLWQPIWRCWANMTYSKS